MAKIQVQAELGNIKDPTEFIRFCSQFIQDLQDIVNGQLEFDVNFKSQIVEITFEAPNQTIEIKHSLNRTGVRYLVAGKSVSCDVYDGDKAQTSSAIYLRSTVAPAKVNLVLF